MSATPITEHPIFLACCAKERSRYAIETPFRRKGWWCGTDGRIVVRVSDEGPDTAFEDGGQTPPIEILPWDAARLRPVLIGEVPTADIQPCSECAGTGYHVEGAYRWACEDCEGGTWTHPHRIDLGPTGISDIYARLLVAHGVTEVAPMERKPRVSPVWFVLPGGIEGLLMPFV